MKEEIEFGENDPKKDLEIGKDILQKELINDSTKLVHLLIKLDLF